MSAVKQSSNMLNQGLFLKLWKCPVSIHTNQTWKIEWKNLKA